MKAKNTITTDKTNNETHFIKIYYFIIGLTIFGALLTILLTFVPVGKGQERFADTGLIFWLSTAVSSGIGYLIGSSAKEQNRDTRRTESYNRRDGCEDCDDQTLPENEMIE